MNIYHIVESLSPVFRATLILGGTALLLQSLRMLSRKGMLFGPKPRRHLLRPPNRRAQKLPPALHPFRDD